MSLKLPVPSVATGRSVAKAPCKECPFRRASPPGWLGGSSADDYFHAAHGEHNIPCHTGKAYKDRSVAGMRPCAGLAIYRNNVCKRPYVFPQAAKATDAHAPDLETVFGFGEFLAHHKKVK